jgi:arabinose-5-phosphate isomerase
LIARCEGQIVVTGVGKSGHVAAKIATMLASTGTPATFLHAGEAIHGDLGGLRKMDVVIVVSHSGENPELIALMPVFKRLELPVIAILDNLKSTVSLVSNIVLVPGEHRTTPSASRARRLRRRHGVGDAIALAVAQHRGLNAADFEHHPAALGKPVKSVYNQVTPTAACELRRSTPRVTAE